MKFIANVTICQKTHQSAKAHFGVNSVTPLLPLLLNLSWMGCTLFHPIFDATRELFLEIAWGCSIIPPNSVTGIISRERWQQRWKKAKEDTSLSQSGLHFGHYIVGADCDYVSLFHALRVSLALTKRIALERWLNSLSVMLDFLGVQLVSKQRAILLMEADFNFMNKEVYGICILEEGHKYKLISEEIFSKKNCMADDGGLAKTLFYNIVWQTGASAAIAFVDASNCYDQTAHAMASLIFQSFGVKSTAVSAMLKTKQKIRFFLRTAYGDSKTFAGLTIQVKTQGLGQGNGVSHTEWCIISIMILWVHGAKGHGARFLAPLAHVWKSLLAILYVKDTNLLHLNMDTNKSM